MTRKLGALFAAIIMTLSLTTAVFADAGNPIQGTISQTTVDNHDGTVTITVKGEWNWLSHNADCNYDRAATGAGIIWNDLNGPGTSRGVNEVQRIALSGTVTNATFKITFKNPAGVQTTSAVINAADTAAQLQAKLEAMASIGTGNVSVTGGPGTTTPWNIEFIGALAKKNVNAMTAGNKSGGLTVTMTTPTAGVAPIYNGYLLENGGISAYVGTSTASTKAGGAVINPQDRMVHPVDIGKESPATLPGAPGQVYSDPVSNNPASFATWKGGCGREPLTLAPYAGDPYGSWGYHTGAGTNSAAYSHTYRKLLADGSSGLPDQICVNFYDVHGGGTTAPAFQAVKNASEITVDGNGDNSIDTNAFDVTDGANCIKLSPPATPAIVTTATGANLSGATTTISDSATLTGANAGPDIGDIVFKAYSNATCTTQVGTTQTVTAVTGNGTYGPVNVTVSAPGTYYWQASFLSSDTGPTGNEDAIGVCGDLTPPNHEQSVVTQPHIVIDKVADDTSVNAGQNIGFTMVVYNTGNGAATGVNLNDPLPTNAGLNWTIDASATNPGSGWGSPTSCVITGAIGAQVLDCGGASGTTVPANTTLAGSSFRVHVSSPTTAATGATCAGGNNVNNDGDVTSDGNDDDDDASICVKSPSIKIDKTADATSVNAGQNIGFTITVYNDGTGTATGTKLSDNLPGNTGLNWTIDASATNPGTGWGNPTSCAITGAVGSQVLNCGGAAGVSVPTVTQAASSFTVHVSSPTTKDTGGTCPTTGVVNNTGHVSTGNDGSADDDASVCVKAPSIKIDKTADNTSVNAGENIGFTITVYNDGTGTSSGTKLSDNLPGNTGLNWTIDASATNPGTGWGNPTSCAITGAVGSQVLNCGGAAGVSVPTVTQAASSFTVHVSSPTTKDTGGTCPTTGVVNNTGHVSTGNDGSADDDASVCVKAPSIKIDKTADNTSVNAGENIGFTITVYNDGTGTSSGTKLSDNLPGNTGLNWTIDASATNPGTGWGNPTSCAITGAVGSQVLNCGGAAGVSVPTVTQAASSFTVHVSSPTTKDTGGTCPTTGVVNNTGHVSTGNDGSADDDASVCVKAPSIKIDKTADNTSVNAGENIGFTITVYNDGTGTSSGTKLSDNLPGNTGLNWTIDASATNPGTGWGNPTSCAITGAVGSQVLNCGGAAGVSVPTVTQAASSFTVHVSSPTTKDTGGTCPTTGVVNNTGHVSTGNDGSADDDASVCVKAPSIKIDKTADNTSVNAGENIGFTITVYNDGTGTSSGTKLSDNLPGNTGLNWTIDASATNPGTGWGNPTSCAITGAVGSQVLNCGGAAGVSVPTVTQAASSFTVHVSSPTTKDTGGTCPTTGVVNNTGHVSTGNDGSADDDASVCVKAPAIHVAKVADAHIVNGGDTIGFTITVWNTGAGDATGVTLTDTLPGDAGLNWTINVSATNPGTGWGNPTSCVITGAVGSQSLDCGGAAGKTVPAGTTQAGSAFTVHISSPTTAATTVTSPVANTAVVHTGNDGTDQSTDQIDVVGTNMRVQDQLVGLTSTTGNVTYTAYHSLATCQAGTGGTAAGGGAIVGGSVPLSDVVIIGPTAAFGDTVFFTATYTNGATTFTTACNEMASSKP